MQEILNRIDTCTTPIPLQELIPFLKDSTQNIQDFFNMAVQTRATNNDEEITTLITGSDGSQNLYTRVQTYIDADLANSLNYYAGTYYVTCKAVYKAFAETDAILYTTEKVYDTDAMGVNPETLADRGYSSEQVTSTVYKFTTYIWGISNGVTTEYPTVEWIPRWYTGSGYMIWGYENDFMKI
ncbi:MAG: hypothetical protein LUD02_11920 [Tannerellaceae bacterium]|nr:hypothetical protein [Tannerellaceae bacterium]